MANDYVDADHRYLSTAEALDDATRAGTAPDVTVVDLDLGHPES
jgi:hypothetical protein